jgi:FtsP/CotA-like multicopper oxidase with cupredoxin domain
MLSRNGRRPPPWERGLKETFLLDPGERVIVAGRFSDYAGKYVVHCHMLEHEDHGLMSQFATV